MEFPRLFSPITIRGMTLKNRVVMPAIHHLYTPDGFCTERFSQYYWKRAEGGAALVITGGCRFEGHGGSTAMMSLQSDAYIPGYRTFTDGMHQRGAKVAVQLYHAGRYAKRKNIEGGDAPLAPSAVYAKYSGETPRAMTEEDIHAVIQAWCAAAVRAQKAGFDAVELVGSAGYLISQFLSPLTNLRTDSYGGTPEKRRRFPLELLRAVRAAVGPDYPILLRVSGNDFVPGSNTNEQAVAFCQEAEAAGVDLFNVTGGWHETKIPQLPGEVPRGQFSYLAAAIKRGVHVPVMVCNRIHHPALAEEMLALERGDLVGIGRPFIADPMWAKKAMLGHPEDIRPCMSCNQGCLAKTFFGQPVECLVNGWAGREGREPPAEKTRHPQKLLVVGGGPGGCECAIEAAKRGHRVTLLERSGQVGGQLPLVAAPPGKEEFQCLQRYFDRQLVKYGVEVRLHTEATPELLLEADCDRIVLATGALPKQIPLPLRDDSVRLCSAQDILSGRVVAGKHTLVLGGGSVGCETANDLARQGSLSDAQLSFLVRYRAESEETIHALADHSDREVSILDIAAIGSGFEPGTGWPVLGELKRLGVRQYPRTALLELKDGQALLESQDQQTETGDRLRTTVPCDTLVVAVGYSPQDSLAEPLRAAGKEVCLIGDAAGVGKISDAIRQADQWVSQLPR